MTATAGASVTWHVYPPQPLAGQDVGVLAYDGTFLLTMKLLPQKNGLASDPQFTLSRLRYTDTTSTIGRQARPPGSRTTRSPTLAPSFRVLGWRGPGN
jgi:hypothetical protein